MYDEATGFVASNMAKWTIISMVNYLRCRERSREEELATDIVYKTRDSLSLSAPMTALVHCFAGLVLV